MVFMLSDEMKDDLRTYVPADDLLSLYGSKTGEYKKHLKKDTTIALFAELESNLPEIKIDLDGLIRKYKFAGKCSVSWGIPIYFKTSKDEKPIEKKEFDKETIEKPIKDYTKDDPFSRALRPDVKTIPSINRAIWVHDGVLRLEFVYKGRTKIYEENYQKRVSKPTVHATAFIKLGDTKNKTPIIIAESRIDSKKSKQLLDVISKILGAEFEQIDFSDNDIARIKREIKGFKRSAKLKPRAGEIALHELHAAPTTQDLDDVDEYKEKSSKSDMHSAKFRFLYKTSDGINVEVSLNISKNGNIWFITETPEEAIDYVFSCVRRVKGF